MTTNKVEKFKEIVAKKIKRPGIEKLMEYLEKETDFFDAPCSTMFHLNRKGGLVEHSINVFNSLLWMKHSNNPISSEALAKYDDESLSIVSLFHDICKANSYTTSTRNVKNEETGRWEKVPFYKYEPKFPMGHGEKSVYLLMKFIELSDEEALAVRWHMGGFDKAAETTDHNYASKIPIVTYLHLADMEASHITEEKAEN